MSILLILNTCCRRPDRIRPPKASCFSLRRGLTDTFTLKFFRKSWCQPKCLRTGRRLHKKRWNVRYSLMLVWGCMNYAKGGLGRKTNKETYKVVGEKETHTRKWTETLMWWMWMLQGCKIPLSNQTMDDRKQRVIASSVINKGADCTNSKWPRGREQISRVIHHPEYGRNHGQITRDVH